MEKIMGRNYVPDNISDPNGIAMFTDPIIKGTMDLQGVISKNGVALDADIVDLNLLNGYSAASLEPAKVFSKEVDCSGGGTAKTTAICTVPAGSILLNVMTLCTEAFDGDATTTFEVGITDNTDKYIDPVDCPVTLAGVLLMTTGTNNDQKVPEALATDTPIIATWTNTANMTEGKVTVKVVYC